MKYKTACLRGYLEVIGGVLLKGPLLRHRLAGLPLRLRHGGGINHISLVADNIDP